MFPYKKSLIDFKPNQKLLDEKGYRWKVDTILNKTYEPHKDCDLDEKLDRFSSDYRGKLGMMDGVLNTYMNEARYEFLIKPSPYHTKDEIEKYIE